MLSIKYYFKPLTVSIKLLMLLVVEINATLFGTGLIFLKRWAVTLSKLSMTSNLSLVASMK